MNDEQNHNDPIERLFREKAGEYDISYREEDWLKLEKQLDARDMKLYYQRRLRWLAAASILILSLIGYYTIQNHNQINQLAEQLNQNEAVEQSEQPANEPNRMDNESQLESPAPSNTENSIDNEIAGNGNGNQPENQGIQESSEGLLAAQNESEESENGDSDSFSRAAQIIDRKPIDSIPLYSSQNLELLWADHFTEPVELLKESDPVVLYDSEYFEPKRGSLALLDNPPGDQPFTSALSRLAVGIVVSPDLSTVGSVSNFYDPGYKGGIVAEFALTKNISLVSGAAISNVKYKASGQEYNPPQAWNYGMMPDQTTAVCLVLDIPINLKANIFNFNRSRIFTTAGLSSYIMLNEDYQFSYNGDASGLETSWSEQTGTSHWFSNAGLSIGFEYDISPSWTIRAEPHIKIPLKGVGWGDVDLYSMGSFLSLNYRFDR